MKDQKNKSKLTDKELLKQKRHQEKLELLQKVKSSKENQLVVDFDDDSLKEVNQVKELLNKSFDDPDEKYELYYKGIRKALMKYLPSGPSFKQERDIIYDEKNIFLNRGKAKDARGIRGGDGRMAFNDDMHELVDLIADWIMTSQDPVDLYQRLYDLNDKHNYGHQQYDDSSPSFHKAMSKIAKVPKPKDE